MTYEVEQKFEVSDHEAVQGKLSEYGAQWSPATIQVDRYFAHPAKDFGETDEALRIRRSGNQYCVTYKGPKVDATTKTRREIEISLPEGNSGAADFDDLLVSLGFRLACIVSKERLPGQLHWEDHTIYLALDTIKSLGSFVELEVTCDEASVEAAKRAIASLATDLGLTKNQRLSYLELLMQLDT